MLECNITSKKRLLKNKIDDVIVNHMAYKSVVSRKKHNYLLKITIYLEEVNTDK